jgi:prepilin-type N-terminal cleavage/methylation domain-containing protein/prepilin-type processing-associated H-X9-DG protein
MKTHSRNRGFTLVEILVTIAIIATLAGATFSLSSRAKQSAVSAKTLANLRDIGVGATLWTVDNNGFYPPCWDGTNTYAQYLDPYMHSVEKYRSTDSRFIGPNKRLPVKVNNFSHPITYSANKAVWKDKADGLLPLSKVSNPADVIMLADGCQNPGNLNQANASNHKMLASIGASGPAAQGSQAIPVGPDVDTAAGDAWFRYAGGKCHVLFCDGTAKALKKGTILKRNIWFDQTVN